MKVIKSIELSTREEKRYVIVDENGAILDDAQGYGYKTVQKAYAAWSYKQRRDDNKYQFKKKRIKNFLSTNCNFFNNLENEIFCNYKENANYKFNYNEFKEYVENSNIALDNFNCYELYREWLKR